MEHEKFMSNEKSKIRMEFKPTFKMDEAHHENGGECNGKMGISHEGNFKRNEKDSMTPTRA